MKSLNKNSKFENFIICIGFKPKRMIKKRFSNISFIHMDEKQVKTIKKEWPINRKRYVCLQSGEFLDVLDFDDNDIIVLVDSDMIMQRKMKTTEKLLLENLKDDEVAMAYDMNPPGNLIDSFNHIKKWSFKSIEEAHLIFNGDWSKMEKCNCGLIAARLKAWKVLKNRFLEYFDDMTSIFGHHAAGQWLITWIAYKYLKVKILPEDFHNGHWFSGTKAIMKNNKLMINDKIVLFAHTKYAIHPIF
ncbi:MAG: hypothetical protein ACTSVV_07630 [Promethearchaeota archaeon]